VGASIGGRWGHRHWWELRWGAAVIDAWGLRWTGGCSGRCVEAVAVAASIGIGGWWRWVGAAVGAGHRWGLCGTGIGDRRAVEVEGRWGLRLRHAAHAPEAPK
jgi:hypothetical protein